MNLLGVADANCCFRLVDEEPTDVTMIAVVLVTQILERCLVLVT